MSDTPEVIITFADQKAKMDELQRDTDVKDVDEIQKVSILRVLEQQEPNFKKPLDGDELIPKSN